ncbi:MAG: GNAT family N-acetyltransferase [Phycisphaerales bacterium]
MIQSAHISLASSPADLANAAVLFREYVASLPFPLDYQDFENEVANLPGKYAQPKGCILIAWQRTGLDQLPVGCIAMRPIDLSSLRAGDIEPVCEMKRMYVKPAARGLRLGRLLAERLLEEARKSGYRMMKLDTETTFTAATTLYRSLGFVECERYNDDPQPDTIWMRLKL